MLGLSLAMTVGNPTLNAGVGVRPVGRSVAFFGDSRVIQALYSSSRYGVRSFPYWMRLYTNQSVDTTAALNFGVSSDTTEQMAARVDAAVADMVAAGVGTMVFLGGTNDVVSIGESSADISYCVAAARAAGIVVIVITETPRDTENALHLAIRDYCRTLNSPGNGIYTVDIWPTLANGDAGALAGVTVDGTHLSVYACRILGLALATKLNTLISQRDILPTANENSNAAGLNILTNAMLTGVGGTATNLEVGSVVAAACSVNNTTTGALVTASIGSRHGYNTQRIQITGTPTAAAPNVRFEHNLDAKAAAAVAAGIFKAGDVIDGGCYIHVAAGTAGVKTVKMTLLAGAAESFVDGNEDTTANTSGYNLDSAEYEGVSRIIRRAPAADSTNLRLRVDIVGIPNVPMTADIEVARLFELSLT